MNTGTFDGFAEEQFFAPGHGKGRPPFSVVPEPAFYGLVLVGLCVALAWRRRK